MEHFKDCMFTVNGRKKFVLGINYLPAKWGHSGDFWKNVNESELRRDFKMIRGAGVEAIRLPLPLTIMKKAGRIEKDVEKAIHRVIGIAIDSGLLLVPNFFHTGGFWNTDWITSQTAFSSPTVLKHEARILKLIVDRYKHNDKILGWDICNEPWWIFGTAWQPDRAKYREPLRDWVSKFTAEMRKIGADQPFTIGVDHAGICQEVGGDVDAIAANIDFTSPHFYSRYIIGEIMIDDTNTLRDTYYGPFNQVRATPRGKACAPCEFGNSTQFISERKQADHMRILFYSSLTNGATGWFPWVFQDFQESSWKDYQHQPHEVSFGMFRADGSEKPAVNEFRNFAKFLKSFDHDRYKWTLPQAAIMPAKNWYGDLSFVSKAAFNSFCLAKEAGIDVEFTRMDADWSAFRLVICLETSFSFDDISKIRKFVEAGGVFITSPTSSYLNSHCGQDLFGVQTEEIVYLTDNVSVKAAKNWMRLKKGTSMNFRSPKLDGKFLYSMSPAGCEVLMKDSKGRPALVCNKVGKGYALHISFPLEYAMSVIPWSHQEIPAHAIYGSLADLAGIRRDINAIHPWIETGILKSKTGYIAMFINHENKPVRAPVKLTFKPKIIRELPGMKKLSSLRSIQLPPSGVRTFLFDL